MFKVFMLVGDLYRRTNRTTEDRRIRYASRISHVSSFTTASDDLGLGHVSHGCLLNQNFSPTKVSQSLSHCCCRFAPGVAPDALKELELDFRPRIMNQKAMECTSCKPIYQKTL